MAALRRTCPRMFELADPCEDTSVGDLLDHIRGFSMAFGAEKDVARKRCASADAAQLPSDGATIPRDSPGDAASAWRGPMTKGGVDIPGEMGGLIKARRAGRARLGPRNRSAVRMRRRCSKGPRAVAPLAEGAPNPGLFGPPAAVADNAGCSIAPSGHRTVARLVRLFGGQLSRGSGRSMACHDSRAAEVAGELTRVHGLDERALLLVGDLAVEELARRRGSCGSRAEAGTPRSRGLRADRTDTPGARARYPARF